MKEKIENNKIFKLLEKHEYGFFLFIVLFISAIYYISYTIHNIPYTSGWGNSYADLVFSGKFPYRDFYYYLPPFNLIIDCVFWKLSFGHLFVYVAFRFIERMVIIFLSYNLLCKIAKPRYVSIGVILGAIMFGATVYDMVGDYNQTALLINVLLTNIYFKYIQIANNNTSIKKQNKYLFLGGIILGISFLHKQTIFLAQCIIFFITLTVYFIVNHKKNYVKSLFITLIGMLIPITIATIVLGLNGALMQFIDQVFLKTGAKGSIFSIVTSIITACLKWKHLELVALLIAFIYTSKKLLHMQSTGEIDKNLAYLLKFTIMIIINVFILYIFIKIQTLRLIFSTTFTICAILIILSIILVDFLLEKYYKKYSMFIYIYILGMIAFSMCIIYFNREYAYMLYRHIMSFSLLSDFTTVVTIGGIILTCYLFYSYWRNKDVAKLKWIIVLASGIVFEYNTTMASGNEINNYGSMFLLATIIIYLLTQICNKEKIMKHVIFTICILIPTTVMSQKVISAYEWWGWQDTIINSSKFYTIDVPGLEGFRVSENVKQMYEEMYKVIKSNTDEESVIYGFPHVRIFNVLLQNTNMNNFVPVPFYDVCADEYIKEDINKIKEDPPQIVVWIDIPNCLETFENVFRNNKKLEQREFQKWFSKSVKTKKYILIGQYDSMFVYKLNDGTDIDYTYYKNKRSTNYTLNIK